MKVSIHTNSQKPIGGLVEHLVTCADEVFVASAYISKVAIANLLARCRPDTAAFVKSVDLLFGMDLETDAFALTDLLAASKQFPDQVRVRYTPNKSGRLFHPKVYYFRIGQASHIIIASANLTQRGHYANEEMYCHIECVASDPLVGQLTAVRQAWLTSPFSIPLDDEIVDVVKTMATVKRVFAEITQDGGGPIVITPLKPDAKHRLLAELEKGFLISTDFSVAPLSVSVPIREVGGQAGVNGTVIIRASLVASVQLLPDEICDEFASLYRQARRIVEQHCILVPHGLYYVPPSAQKSFTASVRSLLNEHRQLIHKHIRLRRPINNHLAQLEDKCAVEWQKYSNQPGIVTKEGFFKLAKERIRERREDFSRDPQTAVRLSVNCYPHPLIYRAQNPSHAVWALSDSSLDDDLLRTMLAILIAQVDAVIEATHKKQQPAVQADLKQAKLLITIRGKVIDGLLIKLSRLANRDWANASKRRKSKPLTPGKLMMLELNALREQANKHKNWLEDLRSCKPQEAFNEIIKQYPSIGLLLA